MGSPDGHRVGTAAVSRCPWAEGDEPLRVYHDVEWGVPERDGRALWEKLVLDGFQAGLSWTTILHKRPAFREAFRGFDPVRVARFGPADVERLLGDPGIVRSRAKIDAAIAGARAYRAMDRAGEPFSSFVWTFVGDRPRQGRPPVPARTAVSEALSDALRERGFRFIGPTIVYAWMQAVGMVNDHGAACFRRRPVAAMATGRPSARR